MEVRRSLSQGPRDTFHNYAEYSNLIDIDARFDAIPETVLLKEPVYHTTSQEYQELGGAERKKPILIRALLPSLWSRAGCTLDWLVTVRGFKHLVLPRSTLNHVFEMRITPTLYSFT